MKNPHKKTDYILGAVAGAMAAIAFTLLLLFGGPDDADAAKKKVGPSPAVVRLACFPARAWKPAPIRQRPCHAITRIFEDGSGTLRLGTARKTLALCTIPNVSELPQGQGFRLRCWRMVTQ